MKISFIGAGKVGTSLGKYFVMKSIPVMGYYSKTLRSAKEAAKFTNSNFYTSLQNMINESDIIFFTVPDDEIARVWEQVKSFISNKIIIHCSGLCSSLIFSDAEQAKCHAYSVHPLCAVGSKMHSYKQLDNALFTIEGDEEKLQYIYDLFAELGNPVKVISAGNKTKYHAAASLASNHMTAVFYIAVKLLTQCGFSEKEALEQLYNLSEGNLSNIKAQGCVGSLTGPVERNDIDTVRKHIDILETDTREIYCRLAKQLIEISEMKHPDKSYEKMIEMIDSNK